ncbi:Similar to Protein phosphatase PTC7 homolog; acc. no. Q5U3N5 [Pyronema omphalodes CBS 100304]|uniref:Protein phosphatase n=1 Tax=Pyronema omphalodes (strain CBS 100304) TaxID=1076935 RepID=U4KYD7_PYROM|nr:Similar to Protein phosphatase PTC7 homolog; acc. no. Q5U3N5 [Pyronema omphalodes CBS 100304]
MRIHGLSSVLRTTLITASRPPRRIPHNAASASASASQARTFFNFGTSKPRLPTHLQQIRNRSNNSSTTSSSLPTQPPNPTSPSPFHFIPSHSLFAKRPPRPFPPPFHTPPTTSFSDPLTSHSLPGRSSRGGSQGARDLDPPEGGRHLRGTTNGDDAILTSPHYLAVADGVGAWNTKSHGHAPLWSRLMLHFWSLELCGGKFGFQRPAEEGGVDPVMSLQEAYHETFMATTNAGARRDQIWQGTTTVCGAVLEGNTVRVVNLGDSVGMVYRPKKAPTAQEIQEKEGAAKRTRWGRKVVEEKEEPGWLLRTKEQWHWFDCPRQLGTNSPDTPAGQAVVQEVEVQDGDILLLATDGLVDNMWDAEILQVIEEVLGEPEEVIEREAGTGGDAGRMKVLASRIVEQAKKTAMDMFAESPYMERSIDEGLGIEGGKWDDISVVAAVCRKGNPE